MDKERTGGSENHSLSSTSEEEAFHGIGPELTHAEEPKEDTHKLTDTGATQDQIGEEERVCTSNLQVIDIARDQFLVGIIFMRKYYTIFDRDNDRIGLAEAVTGEKAKTQFTAR